MMRRPRGVLRLGWLWKLGSAALAACLPACSGQQLTDSQPLVFDAPFDPNHGASSIVMHRPLPIGTRLRTEGLFRNHFRTSVTSNGFLLERDDKNVQLAYDLTKTIVDVDLDGDPSRVRYAIATAQASDADIAPLDALGEGRGARLHEDPQITTSGGQILDLEWASAKLKVSMLSGSLSSAERAAFTDPFGPAYELYAEQTLARMFGPSRLHREGEEWDINLKLAGIVLSAVGEMEPPLRVTGRAKYAATDTIANQTVQIVEAWARAEGTLKGDFPYPTRAKNMWMELHYKGAFPVNLSLPPIDHDWTFKGKADIIVEIHDRLGELRIDVLQRHQSRVTQLTR